MFRLTLVCRENPEYRRVARDFADRTSYAKNHLRGNPAPSGQDWVMKCICPFDTEDGRQSVRCENCRTWQHEYCYYLSAIDPHRCVACLESFETQAEASTEPLQETQTDMAERVAFETLSLTSKENTNSSVRPCHYGLFYCTDPD